MNLNRRTRLTRAGRGAVPALLVLGLAASLAGCGSTGSAGSDAAATSAAPASSAADAATSASTSGVTLVTIESNSSCSTLGATSGYLAEYYQRTTGADGAAAVELIYCGGDPVKLEKDPGVSVLDASGAPVAVAFTHEQYDAASMHEISATGPMCLVIQWKAVSAAKAAAQGASLQVAASGDRPAFTVPVTTAIGSPAALTVSQWNAASGDASECLGSN